MSVEDKQAAGTLSQASNGFQQDAAAAVAQMLGPGTSALVELSVKCRGLPDRDVIRWGTWQAVGAERRGQSLCPHVGQLLIFNLHGV